MATEDAPSLDEIIQLTRSELILSGDADEILDCGRAALELLPRDPQTCLRLAYQHLLDVPYSEVATCWRRLYADAALLHAVEVLEGRIGGAEGRSQEDTEDGEDWIAEVVNILDMALILTGAPRREEVVELWFAALGGVLGARARPSEAGLRPTKRRKLEHAHDAPPSTSPVLETFPTAIPRNPALRYPIPRVSNLAFEAFQTRLSDSETQRPLIIEDGIERWPALHERPWGRPQYLLDRTLGGRRLVPVEIGRSYTDQGWGQKIISLGEFVREYMGGAQNKRAECNASTANGHEVDCIHGGQVGDKQFQDKPDTLLQTGYLAQHDLFAQIPSLRADISIPDYCYTDPASSPSNPSNVKSVPKLEEPLLNAWFGPANTISPLHTDPYHNILAQVVGYKYIRLYSPGETQKLYPKGIEDGGIDMSNTSEIDLDRAMSVWPEVSCWEDDSVRRSGESNMDDEELAHWKEAHANFKHARYVDGVLGPGECLYIPVGWWHYVRSLTPSFSVSFWFN